MFALKWLRRIGLFGILSVFSLGGFIASSAAQGTGKHWGSPAEINKDWNFSLYADMSNGEIPPDSKVIEAASKRFVWRITWPENKKRPDYMERILREIKTRIDYAVRKKEANAKFRQMLGEKMAVRFGEIFSQKVTENRIAAINACQIMPLIGKLESPSVMDFFIKLIQDPKQHEIVKMSAIRGMQYFPRAATWTPLHDPNIKEQMDIKLRSLSRVKVLNEYVLKETKFAKGTPKPQIDVVRYIRREAIKALGAVQAPAINVEPNTKVIEGVAVVGLIRVADGQVNPPPLLTERIEAAIGLCRMQRGTVDNMTYQYDPSIYLIGKTLVDFFDAYRGDQPGLNLKGAIGKPAMFPYKITAARTQKALETLITNASKNKSSSDNVKQLLKHCERHFNNMKRYQPLDDGALGVLRGYVETLVPQNRELWAGLKKTEVKLSK